MFETPDGPSPPVVPDPVPPDPSPDPQPTPEPELPSRPFPDEPGTPPSAPLPS